MHQSTNRWAVQLALVAAFSAVGCSKKVDECNAFIKQLNESSAAVQQQAVGATSPKGAGEALTKLASTTQEEAGKIAIVQLTLPELVGFSKDYQAMLTDTGTAAAAMGKAAVEFEEIEAAVEKDRQAWLSASTNLRVACVKARKDCEALGEALMKPPLVTGLRPEEDAKKLDEYKQSIANVEIANAEVKATVDQMKGALDGFAATLRRQAATKEVVDKANDNITETIGREPALVKSVNDFCQGG